MYVNDLINAVKNFKPTICWFLCQPVSVTNCDRSSSLPDTLIAFADDSTVGTTGSTESDHRSRMIALFERVIQWFYVNYLALDVGKSRFFIFSRVSKACPELMEIHVSRGSLCRTKDSYVRFLGILLDKNLSFKHYIDLIKMKVSRSLGILRKLKYIFPGLILRILFGSLVRCYVSYCSIIWMSTFPLSLKPLSKLYDTAMTLIQGTNQFSIKPLFDLKSLCFLSFSSFIFLQLHGHLPPVLCNNISFVYYLRTSNNLLVLYTPSVRSDFNTLTDCNRIWNTLPEFVRSCHSFGMFKNYVRDFLASK